MGKVLIRRWVCKLVQYSEEVSNTEPDLKSPREPNQKTQCHVNQIVNKSSSRTWRVHQDHSLKHSRTSSGLCIQTCWSASRTQFL